VRREGGEVVEISSVLNITAGQIIDSLLAIPAFLPATFCTGYLAAWFTNLHGFRHRSLVERVFWSLPLSLAVSTIAAVLIGKFFSLGAVIVFFLASAALFLATFFWEHRRLRNSANKWTIGLRPLSGRALLLAIVWIAAVILFLVDFQSGPRLYSSLPIFDHGARVNWIESILRTGIPPANSLYSYKHAAPMRNYYFWYVLCAVVARMAHLPVRAVLISSCVWSGFVLVALIGLYLKHVLAVGVRLREQFLLCVFLLSVTGLDICVHLWDTLYLHQPLPGMLNVWSVGPIASWFNSLLWVPHHVASMACCMLAFLLAWMDGKDGERRPVASVVLIATALASAFGISIYVAFGFFIVMLAWAVWELAIERTPRPVVLMAIGGAGAVVLLLPYLWELTHNSSGIHGGSVFAFSLRETVPPAGLLASSFFQHLASGHSLAAQNLANLVLLGPGYFVEFGCYFAVFLIYLIPAWRGRAPFTHAYRSLLFIVAATILLISVLRSGVLDYNDFGIRAALIAQFVLLLLASQLITSWKEADIKRAEPASSTSAPGNTPQWLRSIFSFALIFGILGTCYQALMLRFTVPLVEAAHVWPVHEAGAGNLSHQAYISSIGYAQLDAAIPRRVVVQPNPTSPDPYWALVDQLDIDHQMAIASDKPWCGAELGGDPSGCPKMAADIDSLFSRATAEQARATCRQYGIQYLVARIYDPSWTDRTGWVWTLNPVVSEDEFRAVDCR
jgi:hypothetical protein